MDRPARDWDYLVVTASNPGQAAAYERQLRLRRELGLLRAARTVLTVSDPGGRRVGSGGSTLICLLEVLAREGVAADPGAWEATLGRLRVLIIHAGGDSKRLPPYGPFGKIFVPLPGETDAALGPTVFDRQLPYYLGLPAPREDGVGQVVVGTGDVLLTFDPARVAFAAEGVTGVGCPSDPAVAANHGVYVPAPDGRIRLFLQKPSPREQAERGAIDSHGRSVLDIGILSFDAAAAVRMLALVAPARRAARTAAAPAARPWDGLVAAAIDRGGLDLYREIACAFGTETTFASYRESVRAAGSRLPDAILERVFRSLHGLPSRVCVIPRCGFFHFGTLRELFETGRSLLTMDTGISQASACLAMDNRMGAGGMVTGRNAWVEGCAVDAPLRLGGENVVCGVDVSAESTIPPRACVDVLEGRGRDGRRGAFVRVYDVDDKFHLPADSGGRLGGHTPVEWLKAVGARSSDAWAAGVPERSRSVWNGRFFPLLRDVSAWRDWLWMAAPDGATDAQAAAWRAAERYSFEEMANLADHEAFHRRREGFRTHALSRAYARVFRTDSDFSAAELAFLMAQAGPSEAASWTVSILDEAARRADVPAAASPAGRDASFARTGADEVESLEYPRVVHTLGSAVRTIAATNPPTARAISAAVRGCRLDRISPAMRPAGPGREATVAWADALRESAFERMSRIIVHSRPERPPAPRNALRSDEIVWGRAPVRLDLGGGWTDTPPYALERGGSVINAAVDLNGQAPIQAYARVVPEREIRINSIDHSEREVIRTAAELLDYRRPESKFALAKAALALCGFRPNGKRRPETLAEVLRWFGGGVELTTLAAIPSGSGLGTSSVMGAVLLSVIHRMLGREMTARELFHGVLQLEQELTTGGGWQDQVGGAVEGVKVITTEPGLVPDPRIEFVPGDVLDPRTNGGTTLLYYTGMRRLAKNILHEVVGRWLDRDRAAAETLARLRAFPKMMAEAMARRDARRFGELLDDAWRLNVDLDPNHTNAEIERLRARLAPRTRGAKLLGAGGGGFLLIAARSPEDAAALRRELTDAPPNAKARFFDFSISPTGLVVTIC